MPIDPNDLFEPPPFWYQDSRERKWPPGRNPWVGNLEDYKGGTVYDLHTWKTLQSSEARDLLSDMEIDVEGVVPGQARVPLALRKQALERLRMEVEVRGRELAKEAWEGRSGLK